MTETTSDSLKTSAPRDSSMAGPDNQEPVNTSSLVDSREIPVKASPPREKSPSASDVKTNGQTPGEGGGEDTTHSVPPPDGGWGWAVVFASFMIHIIGKKSFQKLDERAIYLNKASCCQLQVQLEKFQDLCRLLITLLTRCFFQPMGSHIPLGTSYPS